MCPAWTTSWISPLRWYPFPQYRISRLFVKPLWERYGRLAWFKSILTSIIYFSFLVIDSSLSRNFGTSITYGFSALTSIITVSYLGGLPSIFTTFVLGIVYWNGKDWNGFQSCLLLTLHSPQLVKYDFQWHLKLLCWCLVDIWPNNKRHETIGWVWIQQLNIRYLATQF